MNILTQEVIEKIYFLSKQYFGKNENAEDIAHDTFVGILRWPPKEDLNEVDMSYLKKVMFRYARKRDGRNTKHFNRIENELNDPEENFDIMTTETPDKILQVKELYSALYQQINKLPEKMKEGILKLYWKEEILNRSEQVMVWDARRKIRGIFNKKKLEFFDCHDTITVRKIED